MPAWKGQLKNDEIAAVVTYIRSSWGNKASAVKASAVK
jgi:cytochrome c6